MGWLRWSCFRNTWHYCILEEKLIHASHKSRRERLYRWNHTFVKYIDTRFCYETYYVQSKNGDAILHITEPSCNSKTKDHSEALRRRIILWQSGDLLQLFKEAETIQKGLTDSTKPKSIAQLPKKFVEWIKVILMAP